MKVLVYHGTNQKSMERKTETSNPKPSGCYRKHP